MRTPILNCSSFLITVVFLFAVAIADVSSTPEAKRLYDDLLNNYNRLIRPVMNVSERLTVYLGLKLSQLIEVNLKHQIMTTNVWVEQRWADYKLRWDPEEYGGVETVYVPSEHIWLPDIVLYNNADGNYEVTLMTKATLNYTGEVVWTPPAIYKSSCEIDVEWFPFDQQKCHMKFGSWTYDGWQVDLKHIGHLENETTDNIPIGIDLKEFYMSVEWDLLDVPAKRNEETYPCCPETYPDITFTITLRRKTLFYTVNLIIPCVGISFLTVVVFYLPSDSGEKVSLCISILLSLTVFFLLLAEIIPPTSLAVPLLGKYLLFTMILVTLSICVTVCVLNVHFRRPATHSMSPWVKRVFIDIMPRILMMRRPDTEEEPPDDKLSEDDFKYRRSPSSDKYSPQDSSYEAKSGPDYFMGPQSPDYTENFPRHYSSELQKAIEGVQFIAQHIKDEDKDNEVVEDWKYVAMVLDRLFLWVFTLACILGTTLIVFMAPSLYDTREPIDMKLSQIKHFMKPNKTPDMET